MYCHDLEVMIRTPVGLNLGCLVLESKYNFLSCLVTVDEKQHLQLNVMSLLVEKSNPGLRYNILCTENVMKKCT